MNATLSIFQAEDEEFYEIFPGAGQDLEIVEEYVGRVGEASAGRTLWNLWNRPIQKSEVQGIHGTLFYDYEAHAAQLPASRREIDRAPGQINEAEKALNARLRATG